jgi:predicted esterase
MSGPVLFLHGYTQNAASFAAGATPLTAAFPANTSLIVPDAPHICSEEAVTSFYARARGARPPPPYRTWWRASDNGEEYVGWEDTLTLIRQLMEAHSPVGVIGFSQGAMLATLVSALSARGDLPKLRFAVLIAGRVPRALAFSPLLAERVRVPSLHVWGKRDSFSATLSPELVDRFEAKSGHALIWPGGHQLPTRGFVPRALAQFIATHAG